MSIVKTVIGNNHLAGRIHSAFEPSVKEVSAEIGSLPSQPDDYLYLPDGLDERINYLNERRHQRCGPWRY